MSNNKCVFGHVSMPLWLPTEPGATTVRQFTKLPGMNLKAIPMMLSMIPSVFTGIDRCDLERIKGITRKAYPAVPQLSTETLAEWMEQPDWSLLLVDVRTPEEFGVSHLRGALNVQTT